MDELPPSKRLKTNDENEDSSSNSEDVKVESSDSESEDSNDSDSDSEKSESLNEQRSHSSHEQRLDLLNEQHSHSPNEQRSHELKDDQSFGEVEGDNQQQKFGNHSPPQKTESNSDATNQPIFSAQSKAMMEKMGWNKKSGLGKKRPRHTRSNRS